MKPLLAACLSLLTLAGAAQAAWTPPENPDPRAILAEARRDARDGRHADALAKHLWFHQHALKIRPSLSGVRSSFALRDWHDLAAGYPPAQIAFEALRQAARTGALEAKSSAQRVDNFSDFVAMSRTCEKPQETVDLFIEACDKHPAEARSFYIYANRVLLQAERYDLCGKYLRAERDMDFAVRVYFIDLERAKAKGDLPPVEAEQRFCKRAASIVLILVINHRTDKARELAQQARDAWDARDNEQLNEALDEALAGKKPKAFP